MIFFRLEPCVQFVFNKVSGLSQLEVGTLDIFFNHIMSKIQLMHESIPWKEVREKDPESLQFLIEPLT